VKPLQITKNADLGQYSTMRLGGKAAYAAAITDPKQLKIAHEWAEAENLPMRLIGSGSNIIWRDEGFNGLLLINKIEHFDIYEQDEENVYLTVGSGENWDTVVARSVEHGLTGIEALSLIPGTAGATPIQNVGAYGQEIADTLLIVEAYDSKTKEFVTLPVMDCDFGYRTSRFKTTDNGRFFITSITLHLHKGNPQPPFYHALQRYFETHGIIRFTPQAIRDAVVRIRRSKLPDPAVFANNGSFFANPIISESEFVQLSADYSDIPHWPADKHRIKLSAAWLIEQAGFKDLHDAETGMATWHSQPLVLINEGAKSTADLLAFKKKIVDAVKAKFHIELVQEPELLPSSEQATYRSATDALLPVL